MTDKELATKKLCEIGLVEISSEKQRKEGRMMWKDPQSGDRYTLNPVTGYVRIYPATYISPGWQHKSPGCWDTYQINKKQKVERRFEWDGKVHVSEGYERVLLDSFTAMAVRVISNVFYRRKMRQKHQG